MSLATILEEPNNTALEPLDSLLARLDRAMALSQAAVVSDEPPADPRTRAVKHLVFELGETHYAVPLVNVLEIQQCPRVTSLPNTPAWLRGVANLRGEVVSVVDLRRLLEMPASEVTADPRWIVVRSTQEELTVGFLVDRVTGIRGFTEADLDGNASFLSGSTASFVRGLVVTDGRSVAVLDADRVLTSAELRQFDAVSS